MIYGIGLFLLASTLFYLIYLFNRRKTILAIQQAAKERDFKICVVGAGLGGIGVGYALDDMGINYTIVEKSGDVGGTWYDNIYPGVGCDVMSHLYSYSNFTNPWWTKAFSEGPEILEYIRKMAVPVRPKIKFNTRVISATWDESLDKWKVELCSGEMMIFDVIITASGLLHVPHTPKIPGDDKFKGTKMHTNIWDKDYDFLGKRVGVIGTGASAVQAVPRIATFGVKQLTVFQRTAAWVSPRLNYAYRDFVSYIMYSIPFIHRLYRWFLFWSYEMRFFIMFMLPNKNIPIIGSVHEFIQNSIHKLVKKHIKKVVADPKVAEKLTPKYPMGCKRITPSDSYIQSFNRDNVKLTTEHIKEIYEDGIITKDGDKHEMDVMIYATGFDVIGSVKAFNVTGLKGVDLGKYHGDYPKAYLGSTHHKCPNFFYLGGPGIVLGHNTVIFVGECQVTYIRSALETMLLKNVKSVVLKESAHDKYQDWVRDTSKNKVFEGDKFCTGWYRNKKGENYTFWPTNLICFWWSTLWFDEGNYEFSW